MILLTKTMISGRVITKNVGGGGGRRSLMLESRFEFDEFEEGFR